MKIILQEKDRVVRMLAFAIFFMVLPAFIQWTFNRIMPIEYWIEYTELVVLPGVQAEDEIIEVYSFAQIHRPVYVQWNDRLFCTDGQGLEFVVSNESDAQYTKAITLPRSTANERTGEVQDIPWRFHAKGALEKGDECKIISTIRVNGKSKNVESNLFYVE